MALSKIDPAGLDIGQIGGRRNLIINGAMQVAQRGTSAITGNGYAVDRFYGSKFATDQLAHSIQQVSDSPDDFSYSLKYTVTTAETTMEATENVPFYQNIEGFNTAHLNLGTASAKTFTLSFYVKSSLTGTFGGSFQNSATDRSYPFTYTISSANTWERKTVTVAGDTSGTWVGATNGVGLRLYFSMGAGPTRLGTAGAWASDNYTGATGQTQITENLNATWQITGVQLEVGSVATPFEHRSYGEELALCQRYCFLLANNDDASEAMPVGARGFNTDQVECDVIFPTEMRTRPTLLQLGSGTNWRARYSDFSVDWSTFTWWTQSSRRGGLLYNGSLSGITIGNCYRLARISGSAYIIFDAEL